MSGWTLAIDFGTSNTAAAIRRGTGPAESVRLSPDSDTLPSAVLRGAQGYRVGSAARHGQLANPSGFLECPKSELGMGTVMLGDDEVEVTEVVAQVLRLVTDKATAVAGGTAPHAVILTHPQEWARRRLDALREAWRRAAPGVTDLRLVPEPVAAVAWFSSAATIPEGGAVAVFDYGGGTCDVAVLRRRTSHDGDGTWPFEVIAHAGRDRLGGNAIDHLILAHVRGELSRRGQDALLVALDEPGHYAAQRTLRDQVRSAKEMLSEYEDAEVAVSAGPHATSVLVTRADFDGIVADEVSAARGLVADTLRSAHVDPSDLHTLYLTGGSSHIPAVHEALAGLLGGRPATLGDPKLVVALGAHYVPVGDVGDTTGARAQDATAPKQVKRGASPTKGRRAPARPAAKTKPANRPVVGGEPTIARVDRIEPHAPTSHAGHVVVWFDCADHEGERATLSTDKQPGDPVAVGEVLGTLAGKGWQVRYSSPVAGFLRGMSPHKRTDPALRASLLFGWVAEVHDRSLPAPTSLTPQGAEVWEVLRALGSDDDGGRCVDKLVRAGRRGPLTTLGAATWWTDAEPGRRNGVVLGWHGGAVKLAGKLRPAPPFVVLGQREWLPGDLAPVLLTPDNVRTIEERRRGRSWGGAVADAILGNEGTDGLRYRARHLKVACSDAPGVVWLESRENLLPQLRRTLGGLA